MNDRRLPSLWEECFSPCLTRPGFANLVVILAGWVLTRGPHAVTAALVATDVARRRHWETFHRFFSRGDASTTELSDEDVADAAGADDEDGIPPT